MALPPPSLTRHSATQATLKSRLSHMLLGSVSAFGLPVCLVMSPPLGFPELPAQWFPQIESYLKPSKSKNQLHLLSGFVIVGSVPVAGGASVSLFAVTPVKVAVGKPAMRG
jgi:hypothetical protein